MARPPVSPICYRRMANGLEPRQLECGPPAKMARDKATRSWRPYSRTLGAIGFQSP